MGRCLASRGQVSCRVALLRWPCPGQGVTPRKWQPKHGAIAEPDVPQKYWIIAGERPSLTGVKRQEIQDLLQKRVLVTGDIATKLETLSGFVVAGYMLRSATANNIAESKFPLADQLAILSRTQCAQWCDTE